MKFLSIDSTTPIRLASRGSVPEQVHVFEQPSVDALNAALAARRSLLVRGEPGIGKSQLARAAAKALDRAFVQCVVDARTESRDLLWHFDALTRLADAQLGRALDEDPTEFRQRLSVQNYVHPGPLWWVFDWQDAQAQAERVGAPAPTQLDGGDPRHGCVLLIDEIDKAESDVPNGLLEALGAGQFTPLGRASPVTASQLPPLVVVTTNEERSLPDAFLRRCLVLFLSLCETRDDLVSLLVGRGRAHFPQADASVLQKAAELLANDREETRRTQRTPLPGQAEYLDLVRAVLELAPGQPDRQRQTLDTIAGFALRKHAGGAS
ncbi:MAG: MoxR family ATPase [Planctomycetota bacterium]|nr:MoxR family ATPase [Planctomycetota bacterium]